MPSITEEVIGGFLYFDRRSITKYNVFNQIAKRRGYGRK